jgi:hypothetical protein
MVLSMRFSTCVLMAFLAAGLAACSVMPRQQEQVVPEQLPLNSVDALSKMQDGQAMVVPTPTGAQVVVLAGSRMQPVTEEQARPAIEQFLVNERRRKLVEDDLKAMRTAAKIEYVGKFAEGAPAAGGAAAPAAPAPASGALSSTDITKGLGLK